MIRIHVSPRGGYEVSVVTERSTDPWRPWYVATHPALAGCQGRSQFLDAALHMLDAARTVALAEWNSLGLPIPKPDTHV